MCVLLPTVGQAHNGAVTIAVPMEGITVDGDLSDWPQNLSWTPLSTIWANLPENSQDLEGQFAVGYNVDENALYVAVKVQDESLVLNEVLKFGAMDGCELYVDSKHIEGDIPVGSFNWTLAKNAYLK